MTTKHKQVQITHGGMSAKVDIDIADLILNCWKCSIDTLLSCQSNNPPDYVWIYFPSPQDAQRFLTLVSEYNEDPNSIYQKIIHPNGGEVDQWEIDILPCDYGVSFNLDKATDIIHQKFLGAHNIRFQVSVRFPKTHLDFVKAKIADKVAQL